MPARIFTREFLTDELGLPDNDDIVVRDRICGHRRWSIDHELIFKHEDKLYKTHYSVGATEQQCESPWEYEDKVECVEVEPYEKQVTAYRLVGA